MSLQEIRTESDMFNIQRTIFKFTIYKQYFKNPSSLFTFYYSMSESCWEVLICSQNIPRATDLNLAQVQIFFSCKCLQSKTLVVKEIYCFEM